MDWETARPVSPGVVVVIQTRRENVFVEAHERFAVAPSRALQQATDDLFGPETYYPKVDTSLPERQQRRWDKSGENGD